MTHESDNIEWRDGELERAESCLACGHSELIARYHGMEDLLAGLPGSWGFSSCPWCGSLHLDPRPTPAAINKAYPNDYVTHKQAKESHDNGTSLVWRLCNDYLNSRFGANRRPANAAGRWLIPLAWPIRQQLDYFFRHMQANPGRVLDVGCGNGAFLLRARAAGWQVHGIDPDMAAVAAASAAGISAECCSIDAFSPDGQFDLITLSHVFEHLHTPGDALRRIREWLRPDGTLWMALPNPNGLGHRLYGSNWFHLDPPRHLFLPSQKQVPVMLEQAGYRDVHILRRGRGAQSSIRPSAEYARRKEMGFRHGGAVTSSFIDLLASLSSQFSEETVVIAKPGRRA